MSGNIIDQVRRLVSEGGMSKAGLARAAGLHANTLRDCAEESWNPTADTLGKLERFLASNDDRPVLVPSRRSSTRRAMAACSSSSTMKTARTKATSSSPRKWRRPLRSTSWPRTVAA
ncbi:hypothetical protein [Novosphingobium sp. 9]|uniref:hypothetical protein n=1 Tax=Novosphingobium sp. 9 TaxID=2025349 RepID=UPI00391EE373